MLQISKVLSIFFSIIILLNAQSINITGTVVDSTTSQGIAGALVELGEIQACSTRTNTSGTFTLSYTSKIIQSADGQTRSQGKISINGKVLSITGIFSATPVTIDVYNCKGSCIQHLEQTTRLNDKLLISDLWQSAGWYCFKIGINKKKYIFSGIGLNGFFLPIAGSNPILYSNIQEQKSELAKKSTSYTLNISASGYVGKQVIMPGPTGNAGIIRLLKLQASSIIANSNPVALGNVYVGQTRAEALSPFHR